MEGRGEGKERYILLTLSPDRKTIESTHSMTPDWQILGTSLGPAPTLDDGEEATKKDREEGDEDGKKRMMIMVEGVERRTVIGEEMSQDTGDDTKLEELVELFERRMALLRRFIEASGGL